MGCNETRSRNRSASGPAPQRCVGPNIHDPRSTIGSRGFTLVELLVVIAVISLLMAILVPVVGRARRQARALVCRSTLRQWGQILAAYTTENNGRLGCGVEGMTALSLFRGTMPVGNADLTLFPLSLPVDTESIRCCPTADEPPPETSGIGYAYRIEEDGSETLLMKYRHTNDTFGSWEIFHPSPPLYGSYGFSSRLLRGDFAPLWAHARISGSFRVIDVEGREKIPVLLDCTLPRVEPHPNDSPPAQEPDSAGGGMSSVCLNRHNECVNALFLDWSTRRVGLKELWTLKWGPNFSTRGPWTRAGGVKPGDWPKWMRSFKDY